MTGSSVVDPLRYSYDLFDLSFHGPDHRQGNLSRLGLSQKLENCSGFWRRFGSKIAATSRTGYIPYTPIEDGRTLVEEIDDTSPASVAPTCIF